MPRTTAPGSLAPTTKTDFVAVVGLQAPRMSAQAELAFPWGRYDDLQWRLQAPMRARHSDTGSPRAATTDTASLSLRDPLGTSTSEPTRPSSPQKVVVTAGSRPSTPPTGPTRIATPWSDSQGMWCARRERSTSVRRSSSPPRRGACSKGAGDRARAKAPRKNVERARSRGGTLPQVRPVTPSHPPAPGAAPAPSPRGGRHAGAHRHHGKHVPIPWPPCDGMPARGWQICPVLQAGSSTWQPFKQSPEPMQTEPGAQASEFVAQSPLPVPAP